jgi:hypothetical protein
MIRQHLLSLVTLTLLPLVKPHPMKSVKSFSDLSTTDHTNRSWSMEAMLTPVGVVVAACGILVAIRLAYMKDSKKWLCRATT